MTDEEYLFRQTERERKRNARGDYNKKRQGGRHVRLPSDGMTRKEIEKMHGEVKCYQLGRPMIWDEFKVMPDDIKVEYINSLRQNYGVTSGQLAEMFGVSHPTIWKTLTRLGVGLDGSRKTNLQVEKWNAFLHPQAPEETPDEAPEETPDEAPAEPQDETPDEPQEEPKVFAPQITIVQSDIDKLCAVLKMLNGSGAKVTIEITI